MNWSDPEGYFFKATKSLSNTAFLTVMAAFLVSFLLFWLSVSFVYLLLHWLLQREVLVWTAVFVAEFVFNRLLHCSFMTSVGALFLGAALFCAVRMHLRYPNPAVEQAAIGQTVQRNDITFVVEEAGFISRERADELWQDKQQVFEDFRGYFVTVRVTNHGNEEQRISLGDFILATDVYAQGVDMVRFMELNDADIKKKFVMQPGDSFTCALPYMIPKVSFTDRQWERLENMQFKLLLSLYPVKREILL